MSENAKSAQQNDEEYAAGRSLYDDRTASDALATNITFVDCANADDPHQDGTFEHPFSSIRRATEEAGANTTIFVQSGRYDEAVVLRPGQTLTSRIDYHVTPSPPVICGVNHDRKYAFGCEEYDGATVVMRENCVLRRLIVLAEREKTAAILLERFNFNFLNLGAFFLLVCVPTGVKPAQRIVSCDVA